MKIVDNPLYIDIEGKEYKVEEDYEKIYNDLKEGKTILHWEAGDSLFPLIKNMEYCMIKPLEHPNDVHIGDCVFCRLIDGNYMVHRVIEVIQIKGIVYYRIGDTWGNTFGWSTDVCGIATSTDIFQKEDESKGTPWYQEVEKIFFKK